MEYTSYMNNWGQSLNIEMNRAQEKRRNKSEKAELAMRRNAEKWAKRVYKKCMREAAKGRNGYSVCHKPYYCKHQPTFKMLCEELRKKGLTAFVQTHQVIVGGNYYDCDEVTEEFVYVDWSSPFAVN